MNPFAHFEDQFGHLQLSDNDAALHVFLAGWNSAMMEMMKRVNKMPFGDDTRASFAVYFQSQMVNVDAIEKPAQQEPTTLFETFDQFGEGWERLAWELCAEEHGEDACSELIWEGGQIPEPWGDRWLKYEDEAKRLIALVRKCTTPQPAHRKPLPCETLRELWCNAWLANSGSGWFVVSGAFARAIEAAHGIKENT